MSEFFADILLQAEKLVNKYFPLYINWLTQKLGASSSFGTLALIGFLTIFFLLVYVFVRNSRAL